MPGVDGLSCGPRSAIRKARPQGHLTAPRPARRGSPSPEPAASSTRTEPARSAHGGQQEPAGLRPLFSPAPHRCSLFKVRSFEFNPETLPRKGQNKQIPSSPFYSFSSQTLKGNANLSRPHQGTKLLSPEGRHLRESIDRAGMLDDTEEKLLETGPGEAASTLPN